MKRPAVFILTFALLSGVAAVSRADQISKPTGIYRQTILNDITDTLATIGKSDREENAIRHQRRMARARERREKLYEQNHKHVIRR
ncbi:MAG: hypothetical protein HZA29_01830 [Candidatus Omnitrophica bacterium]|nr:hypothetical protein [Candidatus Omnitrophota bacterium]